MPTLQERLQRARAEIEYIRVNNEWDEHLIELPPPLGENICTPFGVNICPPSTYITGQMEKDNPIPFYRV